MSFRALRQLFNTLPFRLRVLISVVAAGLLLILLTQRELVNNAIHILQVLPPVLILPRGNRPPKGEGA